MEGFLVLVYVIMFVWGVLNIILFFKIWGMTNDVNAIKQHLLGNNTIPYEEVAPINQTESKEAEIKAAKKPKNLKVGDKVEHEQYNRDKTMFIGRINDDGSCYCVDENGKGIATYSIEKLNKVE